MPPSSRLKSEARRRTTAPPKDKEIAQKRADYFAAGTQVVWDIDLLSDEGGASSSCQRPCKALLSTAVARPAGAEPALPGCTFPVDNLFPDNPALVEHDIVRSAFAQPGGRYPHKAGVLP